MKLNIIVSTFIVLIFSLPSICEAQSETINVIYRIRNNTNANLEINRKFDGLLGYSSEFIEYELLKENNEATFKPIVRINTSQSIKVDLNEVFTKTQGEFYYDFEEKKILNKKEFLGKSFTVEYPFDEYNWILTEEYDSIQGYNCRKAIYIRKEPGLRKYRKYTITAWINESFGESIFPFGLAGLKGLVVYVNFNNTYEVFLDKLNKSVSEQKLKSFKYTKTISTSEFNSLIEDKLEEIRKRRGISLDKDE